MSRSKEIIIQREIVTLFSEGYNSYKKMTFGDLSVHILKHNSNGNKIVIKETYKEMLLYKNKKLIKREPLC